MVKQNYDESNGLWYELHGDYYLPCLSLPNEEQKPISIWGQRHLRVIKWNKCIYFINPLFHAAGVNRTNTGKNSNRPAIMQNEKTIFEKEE